MDSSDKAERLASQSLRAALTPLAVGSSIEPSEDLRWFGRAMERVIPAFLEQKYAWWRNESLDAFLFSVARKVGPLEAEFSGLCLLISDQAWTPFYLRLQLAADGERVKSIQCKLGEAGEGNGGMARVPFGSSSDSKLLDSLMKRFDAILWVYELNRVDGS